MNVFEHQRFLLRRPPTPEHPMGEPVRLSYREIITGVDQALRFDYQLEYMNVAALGLCVALTHVVFEPATLDELVERLTTPISEAEFESRVAPMREDFSIDGSVRFMQGPVPAMNKKGGFDTGDLSKLILTIKKGDKEILNRPAEDPCVSLDQIPILLFSRATFYEKSAGRGFLTGTSGDLEIRTWLCDPESLRRSIWLNVLSGEQQQQSLGSFAAIGDRKAYDKWMWKDKPKGDVPQGRLTLRSGLLWMVANAYVDIQTLDAPRRCVVSGDMITDRAGIGVVVESTGIGYGVKVAGEKGVEVRMSHFHHPNGPEITRQNKQKKEFTTHLQVNSTSGMIGHMGSMFFTENHTSLGGHVAPVVEQLYALREADALDEHWLSHLELLCFGFHMLSSKQNVHGGYEIEQFHYPLLGHDDKKSAAVLAKAREILATAAEITESVEGILKQAIQICTLLSIITQEDGGQQKFTIKDRADAKSVIGIAAAELWRHAGTELRDLLYRIGNVGSTAAILADARDELIAGWTDEIAKRCLEIFTPIFNDYSSTPLHMLPAHNARRRLYGGLRKLGATFPQKQLVTLTTSTSEVQL